MMSALDELLHEHSLQSVRSDGSQMIALETGQTETGAEWELLFVHKDGHVGNDGTLILPTGEKAVLRKIYNNARLQEIATLHDFVEWRPCVLEERPDERVRQLQEQLERMEQNLEEVQTRYEAAENQLQGLKAEHETTTSQFKQAQAKIQELTTLNASQKRKERTTRQEAEQRIQATAAAIAERTPSETQKIIVNQVELGAGFYGEAGAQSRESFRLSLWLAVAGAVIFFLTVLAAVLISFLRGENTLITIIGSIAAALTEGLAAGNRLYNQASRQFAHFQVDLDRINRSSMGYAMISEEDFEKKTQTQQDAIIKVVSTLLQSS